MSKISKIIDIKVVGTQELQLLEKEILATEQKLKNMNKASKQNAGMQKIHAKNIVNTKLKLKQLRSERNAEQRAILKSSEATVKLDGSYNSLVKRNAQLLAKMKQTTGGINSNSAAMQRMKAEYTTNNSKLKEFDKSLGNNFRNVGNYGSALGNVKEKLAATGLAIGGAVLAFQAISRTVQQLTGDFGEFEKGFTNVLSLMSSGDIAKFGDSLKEGAIDVMKEFGLETADMNKALFDAVSAGVDSADAVDFLRVSSQLAIGGVTDLTTAVDGITTVINAFGLETSEADRVANAFFSAQKFGKTTVEELSQTIGTVAPIAKQAGLSYQELLSAMAELTKQGLNTNIATTALKGAIGALSKPSETAKKEFDRLGISYGISALRGEGFANVLKQIAVAAENDSDALTKLIPNVKALTGIGALGTAQLEDYDEILQQVNNDYGENSSLAQAVVLQQETLEQSQNRLNAEFRAQKILLGEELKPVFQTFINILSFIVSKLGVITATLKTGVIAFTAYNVALALASINVKKLGQSLTIANVKQRILNLTVLKNPYVAAATALATLVGAIFSFGKATDEAVESVSKLDEVNATAETRSKVQIKQVENLLKIARDENATNEQRAKAIARLNSEVKEFNGSLTETNVNSEEAGLAVQKFIDNIIEVEQVQAARTAIGDVRRELDEAEKQFNDFTIKSGELAVQQAQVGDEFGESSQAINPYASEVNRLKGEFEELSKIITDYELKQNGSNEAITLAQIQNNTYANSVVGLRKKIADLTEAQNNAVFGTNDYETASKLLTQTQKELAEQTERNKKKILTLAQANKLEENTINDISKKKAELNKILKEENINSEDYKKIQLEIVRLNKKLKDGELEVAQSKETKLQKLKEEQAELEKTEGILKGKTGVEEELTKTQLRLAQVRLDSIFAEAQATGELSETQLDQIAQLKTKIAELQQTAGEDDEGSILDGVFGSGEEGQERFDNTIAGLNAINGLIGQRMALIKAESDEKIKILNKDEAEEIRVLKASARFKRLTDEQKEKALFDIENKYEQQREVIEKAAFEKQEASLGPK